MLNIDQLKFDEKGLIPAIVQDARSGRVLTLAYMNRESLELSLDRELTTFWSRSRQELWLKGETSGNYQHIVSVTADCDGDALLVRVEPDGPACHKGTESCFEYPVWQRARPAPSLRTGPQTGEGNPPAFAGEYRAGTSPSLLTSPQTGEGNPPVFAEEYQAGPSAFSMDGLYALLLGRKETLPEGSYTSYLFQKGIDKILKKVGEECTEVVIAGKAGDKAETVYELADLAYHALVLMAQMGITPDDVRRELASRHVIDHKVKQEKMT